MDNTRNAIDNYQVPEYRVRLFLSVDLTGSTAFKHNQKSPLIWLKTFQKFYGEFPKILQEQYTKIGQDSDLLSENKSENDEKLCSPKLWKTVGDEILFCCRIDSIHHLSVCINAFIQSLQTFSKSIKPLNSLDVKGNAWVASFPTPNSSIRPITTDFTDDSLSGSNDLITESVEQEADNTPHKFDFLGKGIDSGFRISRNSSIDALTISPGLAILLLEAYQNVGLTKFEHKVRLVEMQSFKGVADSKPYPVLVIDTFHNKDYIKILEAQQELLGLNYSQDNEKLKKFLIDFLEFHKIEVPTAKLYKGNTSYNPPDFYDDYKREWEKEKEALEQKNNNEEQSATDTEESNTQSLDDMQRFEESGMGLVDELSSKAEPE